MKTFHFDKEKYGVNLLMDVVHNSDLPIYFFEPELHCTNFFEVIFFKEANGYFQLDFNKIRLQNNFILFISPFQKRQWFVDKDKLKCTFLIFEKDFLNDFFSDKFFTYRLQYFYNSSVPTYIKTNERLFSYEDDIFEEIKREIADFQNDSPHLLRAILYYMLIRMNRLFCKHHNLETDTLTNNLAYQFKEALEHNIREKKQVNQYAEMLGVSRVSLNKAVKRQFGVTATSMLKDRLIYEVKSELMYSSKTISEIAYQLNFSEPNNLIRLFKNEMNVSPIQFRNKLSN